MYCTYDISKDLVWVGVNDRRLALFENVYPIPEGVSYNAYLLRGEKTVLFDSVDRGAAGQFIENVEHALDGRRLDYVVVSHMEPDHAATLAEVALRHPEAKFVVNEKALQMLGQFFDFDFASRAHVVEEGSTLDIGGHLLTFLMAPMVHWPEVMATYDSTDKLLFSADAFGTFGALSGNMFADEAEFDMSEARRYYANIVGKYGQQTQAILGKVANLEIKYLLPLHGPVWRKGIDRYVNKYMKWATYTPEENAVVIAYGTVYSGTENAANILAVELAERGVRNVKLYDVSRTDPSYIVAEAFRASHLVFASATYNAGIFPRMETVILDLCAHNIMNRHVALVENGSWALSAGAKMKATLGKQKNITFIGDTLSVKSSVKDAQRTGLSDLADEIVKTMPKPKPVEEMANIELQALFDLSYGLYILTAREDGRDNGCIVNTACQITDTPQRITVTVNKATLTHEMILRTGLFNVSVLSTTAPMEIFRHFGFQSGKTVDKFENLTVSRSKNGLTYIPWNTNAFISAKVIQVVDVGTHSIFVAEVEEAKVLSNEPSCTYDYYFKNIKPAPKPTGEKKTGWVCKICGYVYEGDPLPPDFICPICKHGAADFERLT